MPRWSISSSLIMRKGLEMRPEVEAALRFVPRHLFTPDAALTEAYRADQAVVTKRIGDEAVSSASAPWLIAEMLGQAADAIDGGLPGLELLALPLDRVEEVDLLWSEAEGPRRSNAGVAPMSALPSLTCTSRKVSGLPGSRTIQSDTLASSTAIWVRSMP
ncbi:hypothetical protein GA0070214_103290 [Micromonospora chaiyaphumensis]|uniref:Uncharacterized protein n=1 Tax=Micromonospora chaiyaphumensis TaxID=307119 RepID=A0A1C4W7I4_9ACTN|nr:hypothetical protein GA0070214_103290 [Micromonospora chaiyaphumensis]